MLPEQEDFDDFAADEIPQTPDCQVFLSDDGVRTLQHKGKELDLPNPTPVDEGGLGEWIVECDLEEKWFLWDGVRVKSCANLAALPRARKYVIFFVAKPAEVPKRSGMVFYFQKVQLA